jgi:D-alanyl-D-alanine carboxypeptidase (penicillin-binding protein 5/6)
VFPAVAGQLEIPDIGESRQESRYEVRRGAWSVAAAAAAVAVALGPTACAAPARSAHAGPVRHAARAVPSPPAIPQLGSSAAAVVGGPLMASTGTVVNQPSGQAVPVPDVPASAWVIANADTGQVLAAKDPHGEYGPASTLKVLTAVTLIPLLNPRAEVVASQLATSQEPSSAWLIAGRSYNVADLFRALLMISANDAAVALTEATGSFDKGMALINAEARHLQAYDVVAKMPNGLDAPEQVVSAYDEALIARQALRMPAFMAYDGTLTSRLELQPGDWETLVNQNYLLTQYPGGIGGKIGWTTPAEATYIGLARRNGVTLIVTVLHCTSQQEVTSAEQLLDWGFAMNGKVLPVGTLVPPLAEPPWPPGGSSPVAGTPNRAGGSSGGNGHPKTVAAVARASGGGSGTIGFAVVAAGGALAALGLGGLAVRRRRVGRGA